MTAEVNNTEQARASSINPVEMRGKGFAGVPVLRGVDFTLARGEARARRRQRGGRVDADEDPAGRAPARRGHDPPRLARGHVLRAEGRRGGWDRHGDAERWMTIPGHLLTDCWQTTLREGVGVCCAWWSCPDMNPDPVHAIHDMPHDRCCSGAFALVVCHPWCPLLMPQICPTRLRL